VPPPLPPRRTPSRPVLPPGWEDTTGFRETFLMLFPPALADVFREIGGTLHDYACNEGFSHTSESFTRTTLRAIAADLRHLEGLLAHVAYGRAASELAPDDDALAAQAALHVLQLRQLAEALEADLGPSPPPPSPPVDPIAS
jgi:hypothetical protein